MQSYILPALLWLIAFLVALFAWPVRDLSPRTRGFILVPLCAVIFAIPFFAPAAPVAAKIAVALTCPLFAGKLLDAHLGASAWRGRPFLEWPVYLLNPFVLVHRRHLLERPRPKAASARILARGLLEVGAGLGLLLWSFGADLGQYAFWLDHLVKLLATYLFAFDGMFLTVTGGLRLLRCPVIDHSRDPILAVTPADFWRRYNRDAGRFLYEDVFKPLGGLRVPRRGIVLTFLVNGLLHEYLAAVVIGRVTGYMMAFFGLHALAVAVTFRWRPRGAAALAGWAATLAFLATTSVLFFRVIDLIVPWYDSPLPLSG